MRETGKSAFLGCFAIASPPGWLDAHPRRPRTNRRSPWQSGQERLGNCACPPLARVPMNKPAPVISFVSLGCPKALVDSERILTHLRSEGYEVSRRHDRADVVVVNTCGFLDSAKGDSWEAM